MSAGKEQEARHRRRSRTHGFFDHGERNLYPGRVRFANDQGKVIDRVGRIRDLAEASVPVIRFAICATFGILATVAVFGPLILLVSTSVRGISLLCSYRMLPQNTVVCSNAWIEPQDSVLVNLKLNKTPLTGTLYELSELTNMTDSLEFVGLAMHAVSENLTASFEDFKDNKDIVNFKGDQAFIKLAQMASNTHNLIEAFSGRDVNYRHEVLPFDDDGVADISETFAGMNGFLKNSSSLSIAALQTALHTIPYGSQSSLSYNILKQYFQFFKAQEEHVGILTYLVTESKLSLQEMISGLSQIRGRLEKLSRERERLCPDQQSPLCRWDPAHQADNIELQITALSWTHQVVRLAEVRYMNIFSEVYRYREALETEVMGYESWWSANKKIVPVWKLKALLALEEKQIHTFMASFLQKKDAVEEFYDRMMSSQDAYDETKWKLDGAMKEKKLDWW